MAEKYVMHSTAGYEQQCSMRKKSEALNAERAGVYQKCYANLYKIACRKNDNNNLYYKTMKEKAEGAFPSS